MAWRLPYKQDAVGYLLLGNGINRCGGIRKNQHLWIRCNGTGKGDSLLLAAGQIVSALTHGAVKPTGNIRASSHL